MSAHLHGRRGTRGRRRTSFGNPALVLAGLIILAGRLAGQVTEEWVARYSGPANDYDAASALVVDESGNVYVTGASAGLGGNTDYATIKYAPDGTRLWVARYDGGYIDHAQALAVDESGNVYVSGESFGEGHAWSYAYDYATVKYDSLGNQLWVARYDGGGMGQRRSPWMIRATYT